MNKMPPMEHILVFAATAELGSLTAAAKQLGMPTTTTGRKLAELEHLLGVNLLHRTTRQCRLSSEGDFYLAQFQPLIKEWERTGRMLEQTGKEPKGLLRLTAPVPYGVYKLPKVLNRFMADFPKVNIQLFLKNEYVDLSAEGYDLAVRVGPLKASGLVAKKIGTVAYRCVASPKYLSNGSLPKSPGELRNHPCIGLSPEPRKVAWTLNSPAGDVTVDLNPSFTVNDPIYAFEMVKGGLGIAYLPDFIVDETLARGELVSILPGWRARGRDIYAVFHHRTLMPLSVKKLLERLSSELAENP